jgi:hypothetical protein
VDSSAPTVLWRLFKPKGGHARAVLIPGSPQVTLTFFVDDVMDRVENFDTEDIALFRATDVKRALVSEGWREEI